MGGRSGQGSYRGDAAAYDWLRQSRLERKSRFAPSNAQREPGVSQQLYVVTVNPTHLGGSPPAYSSDAKSAAAAMAAVSTRKIDLPMRSGWYPCA